MKERLVKNYITTIVGLLILGFALWQFHRGTSMANVSLIAGYGFLFLRSKDSLIGLAPKETNGPR